MLGRRPSGLPRTAPPFADERIWSLGTRLEFKSPGTFRPLGDMQGGGPFNLQPGQCTDDTSMALCLGESLVRCHGFDPKDQMERYCRWWDDGYLSCTGRCFDIGLTVSAALSKYTETGDPFSGSVDPRTAGNGSLMRLEPVVSLDNRKQGRNFLTRRIVFLD